VNVYVARRLLFSVFGCVVLLTKTLAANHFKHWAMMAVLKFAVSAFSRINAFYPFLRFNFSALSLVMLGLFSLSLSLSLSLSPLFFGIYQEKKKNRKDG
jgi:hypothetical protein